MAALTQVVTRHTALVSLTNTIIVVYRAGLYLVLLFVLCS